MAFVFREVWLLVRTFLHAQVSAAVGPALADSSCQAALGQICLEVGWVLLRHYEGGRLRSALESCSARVVATPSCGMGRS